MMETSVIQRWDTKKTRKKVREGPDIWDSWKGTIGKASTASQASNMDSTSNFYSSSVFLTQLHSMLFSQKTDV